MVTLDSASPPRPGSVFSNARSGSLSRSKSPIATSRARIAPVLFVGWFVVESAKLPVPSPKRTEKVPEPNVTTRSRKVSSFRSRVARDRGPPPVELPASKNRGSCSKVPWPLPRRTATCRLFDVFALARSRKPSLLKSALTTAMGPPPALYMFPVGCGLNAVSPFLAKAGEPIAIKSATNAASSDTLNTFVLISLLSPDPIPVANPELLVFLLRAHPLHHTVLSE
jgi:hypothetical protein